MHQRPSNSPDSGGFTCACDAGYTGNTTIGGPATCIADPVTALPAVVADSPDDGASGHWWWLALACICALTLAVLFKEPIQGVLSGGGKIAPASQVRTVEHSIALQACAGKAGGGIYQTTNPSSAV
jgi:hypothetical protein